MLATTFEVGSRLEVEEGGVWYPVRVTQEDETRVCIHFQGWSHRYDKWIEKDGGNIRVHRKQHTMKRRSRATDDEKPTKRPSTTLKVGGVFLAGARKSARKSTDAPKDSGRSSSVGNEVSSSTATSTKGNVAQANKSTRETKETKERTSTRILREPKEKEPKTAPVTPSPVGDATPNATPLAEPAVPAKGPPPVGWAYEVVTSAQDLLPRKAFTINEDHNDFKCTQDNCNKSFRKEKLLRSHLKHYHNISIDTIDGPPSTPTTPVTPSAPGPNVVAPAITASAESKGRRSHGRRTRTSAEEQRTQAEKSKEINLDAVTETSSSTDISNVTVIDSVDQQTPASRSQDELKKLPHVTESSSLPSRAALGTLPEASIAPSSFESTPISVGNPVPRTPLYGRVGQNRFVPIPEPLVLGREKRKVVKTERMQEAESAFIKKQKTEAGPAAADKKEKRRRSHGGEKEDAEEQQDISLAKPTEIPSDDEPVITPPRCQATSDPKQGPDTSVEKDMVHCPCGVEEESGLMMQCDLCLCWQHGSCFGLENEKHVPERYVCIACQNARRIVQKQTHQVAAFRAMAEGRLPSLVPGGSNHPQRFLNLTKIAETMANLRKALRGIEIRILRVYQDTNRSLPERRTLLDAAVADAECIQRQMDICEKILAAIDRPANDQGSEALILRSTVKSVLKDLWTVQRLTLFK
ncbi:PHD finger protein 20 [Galendromus occidentalis]|uniref:PHD finger protein 20 n=1 Tax=Galendromus occidentalis TaxID=34638 RepID=A0AAJ6QN73_9ACAR|nr:PHD finger protein 20 [Galendromus occidentalis]